MKPLITSPSSYSTATDTTVQIVGSASQDSAVSILNNTQIAGTVTPAVDKSFGFQATLLSGSNSFTVVSTNPCGTKTSRAVTVTLSQVVSPNIDTPTLSDSVDPSVGGRPVSGSSTAVVTPVLPAVDPHPQDTQLLTATNPLSIELTGLKDEQTVSSASIYVAGTTSEPTAVVVKVNGILSASIDQTASGTSFGFSIPLNEGRNVVAVIANNGVHTIEQRIVVTKEVPAWYKTTTGTTVIAFSGLAILILIGVIILL